MLWFSYAYSSGQALPVYPLNSYTMTVFKVYTLGIHINDLNILTQTKFKESHRFEFKMIGIYNLEQLCWQNRCFYIIILAKIAVPLDLPILILYLALNHSIHKYLVCSQLLLNFYIYRYKCMQEYWVQMAIAFSSFTAVIRSCTEDRSKTKLRGILSLVLECKVHMNGNRAQ